MGSISIDRWPIIDRRVLRVSMPSVSLVSREEGKGHATYCTIVGVVRWTIFCRGSTAVYIFTLNQVYRAYRPVDTEAQV